MSEVDQNIIDHRNVIERYKPLVAKFNHRENSTKERLHYVVLYIEVKKSFRTYKYYAKTKNLNTNYKLDLYKKNVEELSKFALWMILQGKISG